MNNDLRALEQKYTELGKEIELLKKQEVEKDRIDFNKIPRGTIVECNNGSTTQRRFLTHTLSGYRTSTQKLADGRLPEILGAMKIRLVTNSPVPWFGGECPLPDNVKSRYWMRSGRSFTDAQPSEIEWTHNTPGIVHADAEIIAYQILESEWQEV